MTSVVELPHPPPLHDLMLEKPSSKVLENRASVSSVDSSISLSFDAAPFTPRGSITASSGHSSSDTGTESKASDEAPGFVPPDSELAARIVDQVEYYFSDENVVNDAFLLKHVRRNKEGYVSLKLIASFKRVKHIASDWRVVRAALQTSTKLQINEVGTKLRRINPLPLYDQTTPSRTVVALNIPGPEATVECVAETFRPCGEIALVRILRPGNPIPAEVRPFFNKHPEMRDTVSALIEFVRTESAHNAVNRETVPDNAVRVLELNAPPTKKKVQSKKPSLQPKRGCEAAEGKHKLSVATRHFSNGNALPEQRSERRWSKDSGSESCSSGYSRPRSNGGVYRIPDQRRLSNGWDSSSESYNSCRTRSSSGASLPDVFHMRRYSLPKTEANCCCGGGGGSQQSSRRNSIGRYSDDGFGTRYHCRAETCELSYRQDSIPDFYPLQWGHRGGSFDRHVSLSKSNDGRWSRSSSTTSNMDGSGRCLSDADGHFGLIRRGSFVNGVPGLPGASESVIRLPRGPNGGRGFQRELIEYNLPE